MVVGAQVASCKGGKHSEQTPGTQVLDPLWSWAMEEVESSVEALGSPAGLGAWETVGGQDTD